MSLFTEKTNEIFGESADRDPLQAEEITPWRIDLNRLPPDIASRLSNPKRPVLLERDGEQVGVVVSPDTYKCWERLESVRMPGGRIHAIDTESDALFIYELAYQNPAYQKSDERPYVGPLVPQDQPPHTISLTDTIREDSIVCLECNKGFRSLPRHLREHGMSADDYKTKYGYNRGTGLVCRQLQEVQRQNARRTGLASKIRESKVRQNPGQRKGAKQERRAEAYERLLQVVQVRKEAHKAARQIKYERILPLLEEGLTQKEIGERLDLNFGTISKYVRQMRDLGMIKRTPTRWKKDVS
jgi:predicted transcriptional regulator